MRLEIIFRGTEATDALKERAEKKFMKVAKHLREPIDAHLVFKVEKHRHTAEVTVTSAGDHHKAQESTDDMYSTIDGVMNKLARSVRRHKERQTDQTKTPAGRAADGFVTEVDAT